MTIRDIRIDLDDLAQDGNQSIDTANNTPQVSEVAFRFTVVTTYDNFKAFLDDLASSLRLIG